MNAAGSKAKEGGKRRKKAPHCMRSSERNGSRKLVRMIAFGPCGCLTCIASDST